MLLPTKSKNKPFSVSFFVSCFWHIGLFSIILINFPDARLKTNNNDIVFLGSFLKDYDFVQNEDYSRQAKIPDYYFKTARQNLLILDLNDYAKLDSFIDKPLAYYFEKEVYREEIYSSIEEFLSKNIALKQRPQEVEADLLDSSNLPDFKIYFRDELPRYVKFNLYINPTGRVGFLKKTISSGSFDADMIAQRFVNRLVFDKSAYGRSHWQTIELNLKHDTD
jgi:hypothetical protein